MVRSSQVLSVLLMGLVLSACAQPPFDAVGEGKKLAARDWVSEPPVFSADGSMAYMAGVVETTMANDQNVITTNKGRVRRADGRDS